MSTWPEARAGKLERGRRERRHYTPDRLGPVCATCGLKVPLALGADTHPTCDAGARQLLAELAVNLPCLAGIVAAGVLILTRGLS